MPPLDRFLRKLANETAKAFQREALRLVREAMARGAAVPNAPPKPPSRPKTAPWRAALGFKRDEVVTPEMIQRRFRKLALRHHPDKGGDPEKFKKILAARDAALKEVSR